VNMFERLAVYLYRKRLKQYKSKPIEVHARRAAQNDYVFLLIWGGFMLIWFITMVLAIEGIGFWRL
jgi:hypothetical protein